MLEPAATARLLRELRRGPGADPLAQLTPRELDVLRSLAQGRSNREIGRALSVSEETVKSHVSSILAKLGLSDRTQAAIFGLQHRLIPLDLGPRPVRLQGHDGSAAFVKDAVLTPDRGPLPVPPRCRSSRRTASWW
ncbi:MAG: response regulator transcription factor [Streptosporangiaceae bacterium]